MTMPLMVQIEITQKCPFRCPQCYNRWTTKSMALSDVIRHVDQAKSLGVKRIVLNGGEPLFYPHIETVIDYILQRDLSVSFFTSGYGVSENFIKKYVNKKLNIYVSLNGSCSEINSKSRVGFNYAMDAITLFYRLGAPYGITWVARADNVMDFCNMYNLASKYKASTISIIPNRPSNKGEIISEMTADDYSILKNSIIQLKNGNVIILIDSCFGILSMYLNQVASKFTGCYAGKYSYSVDVENHYRPCTHISKSEDYLTARDYWFKSKQLYSIRNNDSICGDCLYASRCSPCPLMLTHTCWDNTKKCILYKKKEPSFDNKMINNDNK